METLVKNKGKFINRVLIGTPTTGLVRMEWVNGRYGQTIPTNWSHVDLHQFLNPYIPIGYQVSDAENLIAKTIVDHDFEWFLSFEHDNIPPQDGIVKMNQYIIRGDVPVVGGLYFTKSIPPEPLLYREEGRGHFADWKLGDKVWVNGLPFGFTLIHGNIIREIWKDSPEYNCNGQITRRVFDTPSDGIVDPDTGAWITSAGTSDLAFFKKIIKGKYLEKAGFPAIQKKEFPFLVDTSIFVKHVDEKGTVYPLNLHKDFLAKKITWKEAMRQYE